MTEDPHASPGFSRGENVNRVIPASSVTFTSGSDKTLSLRLSTVRSNTSLRTLVGISYGVIDSTVVRDAAVIGGYQGGGQ